EQRIFGHRQTGLELSVPQIPHRAEQSSQIHFSDFAVRGERLYVVLASPSRGTVAVLLAGLSLAAVASILSTRAGSSGGALEGILAAGLLHLDCVANLHDCAPWV